MRRLIRYIHLNPLEAGLVGRPEQYFWSSHNAYFARAAFTWLKMDRVLIHFGQNRTTAMISLAEFIMAHTDASEDIIKIEQAARYGAYGSEEFRQAFLGNANHPRSQASHQGRSIELDKHHGTISRLAQRAVKDEALRSITDEVLESLS